MGRFSAKHRHQGMFPFNVLCYSYFTLSDLLHSPSHEGPVLRALSAAEERLFSLAMFHATGVVGNVSPIPIPHCGRCQRNLIVQHGAGLTWEGGGGSSATNVLTISSASKKAFIYLFNLYKYIKAFFDQWHARTSLQEGWTSEMSFSSDQVSILQVFFPTAVKAVGASMLFCWFHSPH